MSDPASIVFATNQVANQELWRQFLAATERRPHGSTKFVWIRGHADTQCTDQKGNDEANYLAGVAAGIPIKPTNPTNKA